MSPPRTRFPYIGDVSNLTGGGGAPAATNYSYRGPWEAATAYALGDLVTAPTGDEATPKAAFTSGSSYSSTNWNVVRPYGAITQAQLRGPRVAGFGDSITASGSSFLPATPVGGPYTTQLRNDPVNFASLLSNGRIRYGFNAGISGNTSTQGLARLQTDVLAFANQIDYCVIMFGTNDCSSNIAIGTYASNIRKIVGALLVAGVKPILMTPPPKTVAAGTTNAQRKLLHAYCLWLYRYATQAGIPLVDNYSALIDSATGNMAAAYDAGDGIHPSNNGAKIIGQGIRDAILAPGLVAVSLPPLPMHQQTAFDNNLLSNGLFTTDAAGTATPTGWAKGGASSVASIVANDGTVRGQWARITNTVSELAQIAHNNILASGGAFSPGHKLAFTGAFRSDMTNGNANVFIAFAGGGANNYMPIAGCQTQIGPVTWYYECEVPTGATSFSVGVRTQNGTGADARIAQAAVWNLSALGVDVA